MERAALKSSFGWNAPAGVQHEDTVPAGYLLRVVDAGLCGTIVVAPYFFGGRHDVGRLVLVAMIAVTTAAWFVRQAILPRAQWPRTVAHAVLILAAALLVLQIVHLPVSWIATLSPRNAELLPLWSGTAGEADLGTWQTLSLNPHATTKSLALLLSYGLLFLVVIGRIKDMADVGKVLNVVGVSAALMAAFGIVQYFTSDGRFFWFYSDPFRSATQDICGPFINRNHFADFLVLGVGPLVAWWLRIVGLPMPAKPRQTPNLICWKSVRLWCAAAATAVVMAAVLGSRSRGGAIALLAVAIVLVAIYMYRRLVDARFMFGVAVLGIAVVGLLSLHGYDRIVDRLGTLAEGSLQEIDQDGIRQKIWAANIDAIRAGWLTGSGAGTHAEVCPVYLDESFKKEYTNAENGYLQIGTENGIIGVVLLLAGIGLCAAWALTGLRNLTQRDDILLFGGAAAGLAASAVHSVVDFVWYIPACMTITTVLAGCLLRLAQLSRKTKDHVRGTRHLKRVRWWEIAAATILVGGWCTHTYVGPAVSAIHWDRYLRLSVAKSERTRQQLTDLVVSKSVAGSGDEDQLNDAMLRQLGEVIYWDPQFARGHLRLAAKCMTQFELAQCKAENALSLAQTCDAVASSSFSSSAEKHAWLERAFGSNIMWLKRAAAESRQAVALCPLQGEGYVYLAQLSFLEDRATELANAYENQALRVRPHDADVVYALGERAWRYGDVETAVGLWSQCFGDTGPHQLRIVYWLAGRMPAQLFLTTFNPDWRTLRQIWARYCDTGQAGDIESALAYATNATKRELQVDHEFPPAHVWFWQAELYADAERREESLNCLRQAYACDPRQVLIRRAIAQALKSAGRFAEAESHFRWCLARRPEDRTLSDALADISRLRVAQRAPVRASRHLNSATPDTAVHVNPPSTTLPAISKQ